MTKYYNPQDAGTVRAIFIDGEKLSEDGLLIVEVDTDEGWVDVIPEENGRYGKESKRLYGRVEVDAVPSPPDMVRIGAIDYSIRTQLDHDSYGTIRYGDCEIILERNMTPQKAWATLWHETIHGIMENAGIDNSDEGLIDALAYGVVQVLKDNQWMRNGGEQ